MKSYVKFGYCLFGMLLFHGLLQAQGIAFIKGKWQEVLAKAQAENKPIFVDFYAEWCGPCRFMSKNVFTDTEVAEYYNQHFISVKIDAEKEEPELVRASQIEAYPSLYYFSPDGKVINKNIGALDKESFIAFGKKVITGQALAKEIPVLKAKYNANPNDMVAAQNYLRALAQTDAGGVEEAAIARQYLAKLSEAQLQEEANWHIIQKFVTDIESREFKYVLHNAQLFAEKYGKSLEDFVIKQMDAYLTTAIQEKNAAKANQVKDLYIKLMQATNPQAREAGFYAGIVEMFYQQGIQNEPEYLNAMIDWMENYNLNARDELMRRSLEIATRSKETIVLQKAKEWSAKAIQLQEDAVACYVHAVVLEQLGDKKNAKIFAEKALQMHPEEELTAYIQELIERLK
ncbi:MAG: thioredoxin domain-containing protein [Cytophagales bacterium]|nr:thioredoxin [Bernardetiaceae bacterium]MDW8205367.1 thioredoxin domain-containing protein [Cytophagales bacterium]